MENNETRKSVIVSGLEIPFWDLVWFMVKLALASIPAFFILGVVSMLFMGLFGGIVQFFAPPPLP
jgi:hypothetical protein